MSTLAFDAEAQEQTADRPGQAARASVRGGLFTEIMDLNGLTKVRPAWADLVNRAIEPNAFLEPGFLIPLVQHCGNKTKIGFLLTWTGTRMDPRHKLLGLLPLSLPFALPSLFARGASHKYAPLGTPLFDKDQGNEALRQMVGWLRQHHPGLTGLMLTHLPKQGLAFAMLSRHATASQNRLYLFNECERAALARTMAPANQPRNLISGKRRKEYRRQRRRLSESGEISYRSIRDPAQIRQVAEEFLSLEARGWKGARKTALLMASSDATFFRAMTRSMALEGKCHIDSLDVDGTPVAMGVILESGGKAFYWKTAYDERLAAFSPGVQLALELTRIQLASPSVALTDSCAIANHSMINHIWKDRVAMTDVLLPIGSAQGLSFTAGLWREIVQQRLRRAVKSVVKHLLRRH
jgi:CelD/BcsL family acetyltransferase involved in cellulose biosynthesis